MSRRFQSIFSNPPTLAVIVIVLAAVFTHGLAIAQLGYYHDDWYMLWSAASRGADSLIGLFSIDRPFMGVIYTFFYRIIGDYTAGWHLGALVFRTAGALVFYWILHLVWPGLRRLAVLAAVLFIAYPGFLAEPNAATKINHLLGYAAALGSIALTLQAMQTRSARWRYASLGLSLLLAALYLWIYEYMIGLEVMRLVLMAWVQWQRRQDRWLAVLKRVLAWYLPYLLVICVFLFWRIFVFESTRNATDLDGLVAGYRTNFIAMALRLVFQGLKDFLSAALFAWGVQPYLLFTAAAYTVMLGALLFALLLGGLAAGYLYLTRGAGVEDAPGGSITGAPPLALILSGGLITLGAVFPVVLSNRWINLLDQYKAYALHPSAGVMILVLGLVLLLKPKARTLVLVALIAFSASVQSANNQRWADYWQVQRNFWWQLTWRAPDLADNTLVMGVLPEGFVFQQDYEVWGPVNLIYRSGHASIPAIQSEVLNAGTLMDVVEGRVTDPWVRDIFMGRDFRNLLLISQPTVHSCIQVIDGTMPVYSASERYIVEKAGPFSQVARILPDGTAPTPPGGIFGMEPERGWCYIYQQAALARQQGDWERIGALYNTASAQGLMAGDRAEYFVFVEGLVNLGRVEEARALVEIEIQPNDTLRYNLCQSLENPPNYPDSFGYRYEQIHTLMCE